MTPTKPTPPFPQTKGTMMQSAFPGLTAALAMALVTAPTTPALAQGQSQTTVCMTNGNMWALLLPARQGEMEAAGYSVAPCNGRDAELASYRTEMCRYASSIPQSVSVLFEQDHGVTPQKLCDLASEVSQ